MDQMTLAISDILDSQLIVLVGALIALAGTANMFLLRGIKKDTKQVNNAVNRVGPDKKSLTDRVDRIEETLHTIQYDMDQAKTTAIAVADRTQDNAKTIIQTKQLVESLMSSHVENKQDLAAITDKLEQVIQVIPKRKTDQE